VFPFVLFCEHVPDPRADRQQSTTGGFAEADPRLPLETALKQTPNRFRSLLGIARAAEGAGDRAKASEYYGKLAELTKNADTERQEIREAKKFLAQGG